jgi:hypothetical protein
MVNDFGLEIADRLKRPSVSQIRFDDDELVPDVSQAFAPHNVAVPNDDRHLAPLAHQTIHQM